MTRSARTGSGPGSGLATGSRLPSDGLRRSTMRSSRLTAWGGGVRETPTSIAIETRLMPPPVSTVGMTTSPESCCGRNVGMAVALVGAPGRFLLGHVGPEVGLEGVPVLLERDVVVVQHLALERHGHARVRRRDLVVGADDPPGEAPQRGHEAEERNRNVGRA